VEGLEQETGALRLQVAGLEQELARLRRTMESELELQRSRHTAKLEQILEELAGSTLRFSRYRNVGLQRLLIPPLFAGLFYIAHHYHYAPYTKAEALISGTYTSRQHSTLHLSATDLFCNVC